MKRSFLLICLVLAMLVSPVACAEDLRLEGLSLEALNALQARVQQAMWETEDWQEVHVPAGIYEIGVDIPAGKWTIQPLPGRWTAVYLGLGIDQYHTDVAQTVGSEIITSSTNSSYLDGEITQVNWMFEDGLYFMCKDAVVFTPYTKTVEFSFK